MYVQQLSNILKLKTSLCIRIDLCKAYRRSLFQGEKRTLRSECISLIQASNLPLVASPRLCISAMECSALRSRSNKAVITHFVAYLHSYRHLCHASQVHLQRNRIED